MKGKVVLITGGNAGIGKETVRDLAKRGAKVIMACRNMITAEEACKEIIEETKNDQIFAKQLDISSQKSVRDFAADILQSEKVIDVLIHNAGIALVFYNAQSVDGIELTFATNYYGPFLLTHLLIDLVKKSKQGRIVIVASVHHHTSKINLKKLNPIGFPFPIHVYGMSKTAIMLFGVELSKRLKGTGVTVNSLHPGAVNTAIFDYLPFPLSLVRKMFKTPAEGAQTSLYLACSPEVEKISGKYFSACKMAKASSWAEDEEVAAKLWELSKKMVKLTENDPQI